MNKPYFKAFLMGIFLLLPTFALADVASDGGPTTPQSFTFTCEPYKLPFEEGKHYIVNSPASCFYTIPQTKPLKFLGIYKGTVGSSTPVSNDLTINTPLSSLRTFPNVFIGAQNEDNYFTVAFSATSGNEITDGDNYFQTGVGTLPADATVVNWKWGPKPASEFDPVIIIPGILGSVPTVKGFAIDPVRHVYDDLIDTFKANGYAVNATLFPFPYDWFKSNTLTADLLSQKIDSIKQICNCSHVDIVAHSMGGLVARQYIQGNNYKNDVDQVVFIATPQTGAPYAYKTWESGEVRFFKDNLSNSLTEVVIRQALRAAGFSNQFEFVRGLPMASVQELLPIYSYNKTTTAPLIYPSGYPTNTFLGNLNSTVGLLFERHVRVTNIMGDAGSNSTDGGYVVEPSTQLPKWEHGQPTSTISTNGDGTVPVKSIQDVFIADNTFSTDHNNIVASSTTYVFRTLNNKDPQVIINNSLLSKIKGFLVIRLFSPINMEIIAPDGKRLGRNIEGNGELNEIPDGFYSGFGGNDEYAIISNPLPGEYVVKTIGTGNGGHYGIMVDFADENGFVESETNGTTTPAEIINNSVSLSTTNRTIQITKTESPTPTLEELLAQLKVKIQSLDIKKQLKENLLKKLETIEKKIEKQKKNKATQVVFNLENKILKKGQKEKLTEADVQEILDLLDQIEKAL